MLCFHTYLRLYDVAEFRNYKNPRNNIVAHQDDGHVQRNVFSRSDVKKYYRKVNGIQYRVQYADAVLQREIIADATAARRQQEMDLIDSSDLDSGDDSRVSVKVYKFSLDVFSVYLSVDEFFVFGGHQIGRHFVVQVLQMPVD